MSYDPGYPQQSNYQRNPSSSFKLFSTSRRSSQQPPYNGVVAASRGNATRQKRATRRWLWILLSVVCILIVGAILTARYLGSLAGPIVTVDNYYQAVSQKNYTLAYSYLTNNTTLTSQNQKVPIGSQQDYITSARLLDTNIGPVSSYHVATTDNNVILIITATRNKNAHPIQYSTHFTMTQVNGAWKIKDMNGGY